MWSFDQLQFYDHGQSGDLSAIGADLFFEYYGHCPGMFEFGGGLLQQFGQWRLQSAAIAVL
jgi:hypothetical protein